MNTMDTPRIISIQLSSPALSPSEQRCLSQIEQAQGFKCVLVADCSRPAHRNLIGFLTNLAAAFSKHSLQQLSEALSEVAHKCALSADFGGYGLGESSRLKPEDEEEVLFLCSAYLEALNAAARAKTAPPLLTARPVERRGMTMSEKIFAMHDISRRGSVMPGDVVQVDVDWILASELSWKGMEGIYDAIGKPGIFRNDRFWLAGDHRVEPALYNTPKVRALMNASERAKKEFKMTDFQGFNYTILHTEFFRERAQPGMLAIGADSHSCSAGAVGMLSIGMGSADVCMPLVTGQTWFAVPEIVNFRFVNKPPPGVGGKDTILYILKEFKRNTVAADRIVEFTGPGIQSLSCDARFAIANMCTEFGAVTGIFEADERTLEFVNRRRLKKHKSSAVYFKPDEDAMYAESFEIDLSKVESFVAVYPSPDNVVPIGKVAGTKLDGCFIGACTTAEEDLIIGGMVLAEGLRNGWKPVNHGRRIMVPGSKPIRHKLQRLGLIDIYEQAGFRVGVPGCSMCVGQGTDQAEPGETWLSSQNRNFKNRMGPGSIANLASAATVAASSFNMEMSDPQELLNMIDQNILKDYLGYQPFQIEPLESSQVVHYSEPYGTDTEGVPTEVSNQSTGTEVATTPSANETVTQKQIIKGKVLRLGDFIDTDAIAPSKFITAYTTDAELGTHCMEYFMPTFRTLVKSGLNIIVAGKAFGCGSSREVAVNALLGAGVLCVIARSFSFIYARNQPNVGLLGITITDEKFFQLAEQGREAAVDVEESCVWCAGERFAFTLSDMEKALIAAGGLTQAFKRFGKGLFGVMCKPMKGFEAGRTGDVLDIEQLAGLI